MLKKIKCNVCNNKFYIEKAKVKEVIENTGATAVLNGSKVYNAIDCPNCGCQKVLWPRYVEKTETRNDTRRK